MGEGLRARRLGSRLYPAGGVSIPGVRNGQIGNLLRGTGFVIPFDATTLSLFLFLSLDVLPLFLLGGLLFIRLIKQVGSDRKLKKIDFQRV